RRKFAEVAMFILVIVYVMYVRVGARYPYGFIRGMCYVVPLSSVLIAIGVLDLPQGIAQKFERPSNAADSSAETTNASSARRSRLYSSLRIVAHRSLKPTASLVVTLVIAAQIFSSVELINILFRMNAPVFPAQFHDMASIASFVPKGETVFIYNEAEPGVVEREIVAANFLPDRAISMPHRPLSPLGDAETQNFVAKGFASHTYILLSIAAAQRLTGDVELVWRDTENDLELYRRLGPNIVLLSDEAATNQAVASVVRQASCQGMDGTTSVAALAELIHIYLLRGDLQQVYGGPDRVNFTSLVLWAATSGIHEHPSLTPYADTFASLAKQTSPSKPVYVRMRPVTDVARLSC
ncbi:MAG: hypothetical protein ACYDAR_17745, partial [Thermomicrobiales bacterium]